jgi:hypothetical protein
VLVSFLLRNALFTAGYFRFLAVSSINKGVGAGQRDLDLRGEFAYRFLYLSKVPVELRKSEGPGIGVTAA